MEKNECIMTDYPGLISLACIKKIPEQMEKKICKVKAGQNKGTGFFIKIPFPDNNNMLPVFITNNHVINTGFLYKKDAIIQIDIKADKIKIINQILILIIFILIIALIYLIMSKKSISNTHRRKTIEMENLSLLKNQVNH